VSPALAGRIDQALEQGNARIDEFWSTTEETRTGDLKAYSAVIEYLSGWTLRIPAGLAVGLTLPNPEASPSLSGRPSGVSVVESADLRELNDLAESRRLHLSGLRRILAERKVHARSVVVAESVACDRVQGVVAPEINRVPRDGE
jgi:hypothetical protein